MWLKIIAVALGLTPPLSGASAASPPPAPPLAVVDVTVVDVEAGVERPGLTVLIQKGRITAAGRNVRLPRRVRRVDGAGKFLIPGLWDMHAHHQGAGAGSLPLFVANGVLGTRDMGSDVDFILPLRDRVSAGELLGPTIVAAGPILDAAPAAWPFRRRVTDAEDARAAVRELKRRGVDFIKVHDQTPRAAYFAIAEESRSLGLSFAGHVPSDVTIEEASRSGQKSIEHLANFRVFGECAGQAAYAVERCRDLYQRMARNGVWQTPTLAFMLTVPDLMSGVPPPAVEYASPELRKLWKDNEEASQLPPQALVFLRRQGEVAQTAVGDMKKLGVRFLAGCDGLVPGFCLHDELEWMTRVGFTPLEALRSATVEPAVFLGREAGDGGVARGKAANLVLLEGSPLADIRNTRRISAVILGGRLLDRNQLDALLASRRSTAE